MFIAFIRTCFKGNAPKPAVQTHGIQSQAWCYVSKKQKGRNRNPRCVWMQDVVLQFWQLVDVLIPEIQCSDANCSQAGSNNYLRAGLFLFDAS